MWPLGAVAVRGIPLMMSALRRRGLARAEMQTNLGEHNKKAAKKGERGSKVTKKVWTSHVQGP